jgi:CRP-like cAMP-binding protein
LVLNPFRRHSTPRMEQLHALSLFVDLSPAELAIVDGLLHERRYLQDEVIFDAGEDGQAIYIVLAGEVVICRQGEPDKGRIATLGAGTFFGELALLDESPRSAQARAGTACDLIVFFRDDFVGLLDTHARIASKIGQQLLRHVGARMRELALAVGAHQHL